MEKEPRVLYILGLNYNKAASLTFKVLRQDFIL